ncbi:hypothetical protein [Nannocystis sp.]|uniref:hypothetical protein n=1 Tax=Nannocystis sp. TaxID=1962667 RepID=UPI0025E9CBC7|nr:hypothetical protein [Nannocystis sp.]MBK7830031.1 hypothetical protein [Nannocystis sp.]
MSRQLEKLLQGGVMTTEQLRESLASWVREHKFPARVDVAGEVLVISEVVERGGEVTIDRFELDPRLVGERPRVAPSVASRERGARKDAEDAIISGLVDALELKHKATQYREQVAGESGLLYDLVNIGAQTFRELLNLNARANRRLLAALRTVTGTGSSADGVHVTAGGKGGAIVHLDPTAGAAVALVLENHRSGELVVTLPQEVSLVLADGTGAQTLGLRCKPDRAVLLRGERCEVAVSLVSTPPEEMATAQTYLGEMMLALAGGGVARVPVALHVPLPAAPKPEGS